MEIAVNINKKLWEQVCKDFKESGQKLKTDECREWILGYMQNCSKLLIGQKAVDQVHRRLVIEELKARKPKKILSKEDQEDKKLRHELHKARKSKDWRVRGNEPDHPRRNRPTNW